MIDVSDAAVAGPSEDPIPVPIKKAVAWTSPLESHSVPSVIAGTTLNDAAEAAELWFTPSEIEAARHEARMDGTSVRSGRHKRTYSGHKRPSREDFGVLSTFPQEVRRVLPAAALPSSPPQSSNPEPGAPGLCLHRGLCFGNVSAASATRLAVGAVPPTAGAPPSSSVAAASGPCIPPTGAAAGLCLHRACSSSAGVSPAFTSSASMRPRSASARGSTSSSSSSSGQPKEKNRNPHGLTMSQRVAALQLGRPAFAPASSVPSSS